MRMTTDRNPDKFRIFVSYSRDDDDLARKVIHVLRDDLKLVPLWDDHIRPGAPFTDEIKGLITHAHIFMPLITERSRGSFWVHQETGYAMALNIPVLPLAIGDLPGGGEMIAHLEAVRVRSDLSDLQSRLEEVDLESVVVPPPPRPRAVITIAEHPEERARLIAESANRVLKLQGSGRVRHRGALSSFCLPDQPPSAKAWNCREGRRKRSDLHRILQREERRALEKHARKEGCSLILDHTIPYADGKYAARSRLATLKAFLQSMPPDRVWVALTPRAREGNVIIVGDWFVAESRVPKPGVGYWQTVLNWHAPTVLQCTRTFDQEFEELCEAGGLRPEETWEAAIASLDQALRGLPPCPGCVPGCR
jgi:hypothetical protein